MMAAMTPGEALAIAGVIAGVLGIFLGWVGTTLFKTSQTLASVMERINNVVREQSDLAQRLDRHQDQINKANDQQTVLMQALLQLARTDRPEVPAHLPPPAQWPNFRRDP